MLSAKGVKGKSLGQRSKLGPVEASLALKARNNPGGIYCYRRFYFALSALAQFMDANPERCPRLFHFAPLALKGFIAFLVELATFAIEIEFIVKRLEADA